MCFWPLCHLVSFSCWAGSCCVWYCYQGKAPLGWSRNESNPIHIYNEIHINLPRHSLKEMASEYNLKITSFSVPHLGCYIPALLISFLTPHILTGSTLKMIIKAVLRISFFMYNVCQKLCNFGLSTKHLFRRRKSSLCKFTKCKHVFCYVIDLIVLCWLLLIHPNQFEKLMKFHSIAKIMG